MVHAAALVIVLLHLHASDTLKEDNEAAQPQPPPASRPQPAAAAAAYPGPIRASEKYHHAKRGVSREDEDLLDLMVRLAESPDEWERIHRVLRLIGQEKDSFETTESIERDRKNLGFKETKNISENESNSLNQNRSAYKTTSVENIESSTVITTTMVPLTTAPSQMKITENYSTKAKNMDTGWPDFEEAIVKKVKIPNSFDENDILETNWLEDDWMDFNWNNYLGEAKNEHSTSKVHESVSSENRNSPMDTQNSTIETSSDVPRSRLFSDPKILEYRLGNETAFRNHTVEQNTSDESGGGGRSGRPRFVYHRVTTSPQERRGNSAFIAVSVVRQSGAESPASTPPPPLALWDHFRRVQNSVQEPSLPKLKKQHPHWRQELHRLHKRGRRHHRTQHHANTLH